MALQITTPPSVEPVTLTEAKLHLRVDSTADEALITSLIVAARERCEIITNRTFINTTYKLSLDCFPYDTGYTKQNTYLPDVIRVPRPKLSSVSSITYVDTAGVTQTLDSSTYTVDTQSEPGRIVPAYLQFWPVTRSQANAIAVNYVAGYGAAATAVPEGIKAAMKLMIGHWYENRESVTIGSAPAEVPQAAEYLLANYALPGVV